MKRCPVGEAVARFFEAAAKANITSLQDPAGRCGEIDPGMNYMKAARGAGSSGWAGPAGDGRRARMEEPLPRSGRDVTHPDEFWQKLFGKKYPQRAGTFLARPVH